MRQTRTGSLERMLRPNHDEIVLDSEVEHVGGNVDARDPIVLDVHVIVRLFSTAERTRILASAVGDDVRQSPATDVVSSPA